MPSPPAPVFDAPPPQASAAAPAEESPSGAPAQQLPVSHREIKLPDVKSQPAALVNLMETLVLEKLETAFGQIKFCKCERCKKDIAALALNNLPPRYYVLTKDRPEPKPDPETVAQVMSATIKAILQVRSHPRH